MTAIDFSTIAKKIQKFRFPRVDLVVGVGTGGIIPAALVAARLGKDIRILKINYRDPMNRPRHKRPVLLGSGLALSGVQRILLVDDVSVTGQTLMFAKERLKPHKVITFVLKGKADYVLFPQIGHCVEWPWNRLKAEEERI